MNEIIDIELSKKQSKFQKKKHSEKPREKPTLVEGDHVLRAEEGFVDMQIKFDKLDEHKRMDRVSVHEQS